MAFKTRLDRVEQKMKGDSAGQQRAVELTEPLPPPWPDVLPADIVTKFETSRQVFAEFLETHPQLKRKAALSVQRILEDDPEFGPRLALATLSLDETHRILSLFK